MKGSTLAFLLVLVLGLGFLAWRQAASDARAVDLMEIPLFEGLDENAVVAVRIDNLERDDQMRFERDATRGWLMVDPVRSRAESAVLDVIVRVSLARKGTLVPESESDPKRLGLDPPRIVLELESKTGARQRIDVGVADLDGRRIHVRARGRVLRVLRDVETMLDLVQDDFRSHSATDLLGAEIVEIHRRGAFRHEGQARASDVGLDALAEEGLWRATAPREARLDPVSLALFVHGAAGLRFEAFVDHAGRALASLGLDPPEITLALDTVRGEHCVLRFGRPDHAEGGRWLGLREGVDEVFELDGGAVALLATKFEDLVDPRFTRFERSAVDALQFSTSEREVRVEKGLFGWTASEARAGSLVFDAALPADVAKVEDLLARLERVEFLGLQVDAPFADDEAHDTIHVRARDTLVAGAFGREVVPETGGRALRFRRAGETVVGLVDPDSLAIARTRARDLWSSSVVEIAEVNARALVLQDASNRREYVRDKKGIWVRAGGELEARELRAILDPLLFVRAAEHLGDDLAAPLEEPVQVEWRLQGDGARVLTFGRAPVSGVSRAVVDFEGRRSILARPELHAELLAILKGA